MIAFFLIGVMIGAAMGVIAAALCAALAEYGDDGWED